MSKSTGPNELDAFDVEGKVESVRTLSDANDSASSAVSKIQLFAGEGIRGDRHAGAMRLLDVRESRLLEQGLPKGMSIVNARQVSLVSVEELAEIMENLGMEGKAGHIIGCLGENLVLCGIPRLTQLPSGTLLTFRSPEKQTRTAAIAVWGENTPCTEPGIKIRERFSHEGAETIPKRFPKAALHRRGLVGFVYSSGFIKPGDTVIAKISAQKLYSKEPA